MITAAVSGDGASHVARGLVTELATRGKRNVLLIDANFHQPVQHQFLGVDQDAPGFSNVLTGQISIRQTFQNAGPFFLLPAGNSDRSVTPVLESEAAEKLFYWLKGRFDFVVIDSSAIGESASAASLAKLADASLLVVRAERTSFQEAETARDLLTRTGTPLLGAVLNGYRHPVPALLRRLFSGLFR